jgi:hypothetical protein
MERATFHFPHCQQKTCSWKESVEKGKASTGSFISCEIKGKQGDHEDREGNARCQYVTVAQDERGQPLVNMSSHYESCKVQHKPEGGGMLFVCLFDVYHVTSGLEGAGGGGAVKMASM